MSCSGSNCKWGTGVSSSGYIPTAHRLTPNSWGRAGEEGIENWGRLGRSEVGVYLEGKGYIVSK